MKIIIGIYFVIQTLMLSALMVLQFELLIHSLLMTVSCTLYLVVSFKSPGHFKKENPQLCISDEIQYQKQKVSFFKQKDNTVLIRPIIQGNQDNQNQAQNNGKKDKDNSKKQKEEPIQDEKKLESMAKNLTSQLNQPKDKFQQENIKQIQNNLNKKILKQEKRVIPILKDKNCKQLRQRYCRVCQIYQPMRVRHCHQCQTCVCTFDHHCPWMDNCIGQKNRHIFLIYLLAQTVQFLCVLLSVLKGISQNVYLQNVYFFAIGLIIITFLSLSLLCFHCYLMAINLTTWQYVRWKKIQYLNVAYEQTKISPFSKGIIYNCANYFKVAWQSQQKLWEDDYLQHKRQQKQKSYKQKSENIHKNKSFNISIRQKAQTQRVISKFQKQLD